MSPSLACSKCSSPLALSSGVFVCPVCVLRAADAALAEIDDDPLSDSRGFPPRQFGDYELLAEVGHGGMGLVYKARQRSLDRIVALKILLTGRFADEAARRRFRVEAESAARLQHPHIVAIHDVGEAEGHPYLTMEFVEGRNLAELCTGQPLPAKTAARYVRDIARAIHVAHAAGVLHRDLKPSNVLVGDDDRVRVTDFGLARRTDATDGAFTLTGQVLGSPNYAAPEQAAGNQGLISAATDVYGFGALLYHLVTGRAPFEAATPAETLRLVLDTEPTAPRTRNPELPRDLETICLKCLRKEPAQRYASAAEIADECDRFLADLPIRARPVSRTEAAWRWCRRHPSTAILSGVAAALLLCMAIGGPLVALRLARTQARAEAEAATSKAVSDFLQHDLLAQADPYQQPDRDLRLRTVLDRAAEKIEGRFAQQPLVEAAIRETLAATYKSLGDSKAALLHFERAFAIYERHEGREGRNALRILSDLGMNAAYQGDYQKAATLESEAVAVQERVLGREHPDTLRAKGFLGMIHLYQGAWPKAENLYAELLESSRRVLGLEHPETLDAMNNLAAAYRNQGKFGDSRRLNVEVLEIRRRIRGIEHPETLRSMNNLAMVYGDEGQLGETEALFANVANHQKRMLGPEHPFSLMALHNLATAYSYRGKLIEGEALHREVLEARQRVLGPDHAETLRSSARLADCLQEQGRLAETVPLYERAAEGMKRALGAAHYHRLQVLDALGRTLLGQGRLAEAESLLRESLDARRRANPDAWQTGATQSQLGEVLLKLGRIDEAEPLLLGGHKILQTQAEKIPAPNRVETARAAERNAQLQAIRGGSNRSR